MSHFNDDELLEYALETGADQAGRVEIDKHLTVCEECRRRLEEIEKDIRAIGDIQPSSPVLRIPRMRPRAGLVYRALRAAALVILGIALGFSGSRMIDRRPAVVSPAYITFSAPPDSMISYVVADATSVPSEFRR
jgi:hypothetical protein